MLEWKGLEGIGSIVCANFFVKVNKCVGVTAVPLLLQENTGRHETRERYLYPVYLGGNVSGLQGDNSS